MRGRAVEVARVLLLVASTRRFLDFEPGIHYPQVHMQSGVTGVNTKTVLDVAASLEKVVED